MRIQKRIAVCLLVFQILLCGIGSSVQASEDGSARKTVKVGFFALEGYHIQDETGIKSGYGYDFLKILENYNNWKYEYVGYDQSWADMLNLLDAGEIDFVTFAAKTPERLEKYLFSDSPVGTGSYILTCKAGDSRYLVGDAATYEGMRIGLERGSAHIGALEEFAAKEGFSYTPVYYSGLEDMRAALQNGEIDGMISSSLRSMNSETVLEEMNPTDFYVIVRKDDVELMNQINTSIAKMDMDIPGWRLTLKNQYYSSPSTDSVILDQNELEYLAELRENGTVLKVVLNPDLAPYSYFEDGKARGIAPTIFTEIARRLELSYEYVPFDTYEEYNNYVKNGEADIDLTCFASYGLAEYHGVMLSNSYMSTTMAMLYRDTFNGDITSVAKLKQSQNNTIYSDELMSDVTVSTYETNAECIEAVINGSADVTYLYTYQAQQAVEQDEKNRLVYAIMPEYDIDLAIGVNEDRDYRLLMIINEGIKSVKGSFAQNAVQDEVAAITEQDTVVALVYDHPGMALIIFGAFLVILFVLVMILMQLRRRRQQMLKDAAQKLALQDALEEAKSASAAKGSFLSHMSHEIRTPLNAIIGYMNIAMDSEDQPAKMMHCVENTELAANHLLSLINDVLDISSIESGKMKIAHAEFALKSQLTTISALFFNLAKEKKIQFRVHLQGLTQEWVMGDSLRLNQILTNLLSNAVKFTQKGGVDLTVTEQGMDEKRVYLRFLLQDTGIGMSPEYRDRMFQPFEQESAKTAQKFGGTGLGLSITNNLINMMGGTIEVDSTVNQGTTFTVSLPFDRSARQNEIQQEIQREQQDYSDIRALIVDQDPESCEYMKSLLKRCGIKSDIVDGEEAAVRQITRRLGSDYQYGLCIIDWNMPRAEGMHLVGQLREAAGESPLVIVATAYDVSEIQGDGEDGIDQFIAKPLFQSTMFDLLVQTFGKYKPTMSKEQSLAGIQGMHVLLAEDNDMNMEIAVDILSKAGLQVDMAENGQIACEKFLASPEGTYDVILMDIQMPVMDGYQATGEIRRSSHPQASSIPIIAMTANAFAEDVNAALASGMNGHISKPVDYNKLFMVLNQVSE